MIAFSASVSHAQTAKQIYDSAASYYTNNEWEAAADKLQDLLREYPEDEMAMEARFFLAESLMQLNRTEKAKSQFAEYLETAVDHNHRQRAKFRLAELDFAAGNYDDALAGFETFLREHPSTSLVEFALPFIGELRLIRNEPQLAQATYERALREFPNSTQANKCRFGLAKTLEQTGKHESAIRFYRFVAEAADEPLADDAMLRIGTSQFERGEFAEASIRFQQLLRTWPESDQAIEAAYWLGRCQMTENEWASASETLSAICNTEIPDPLGSVIHFDTAVCQFKLGYHERAERNLQTLCATWPDSKWTDDSLLLLAELALIQKKYDVVDGYAAEVNSFDDSSPDRTRQKILEIAGRCQYDRKDFEAAEKTFCGLIDGFPGNEKMKPAWNYMLGVSKIGLKKFHSAAEILEPIAKTGATDNLKRMASAATATAYFGGKEFERAIPFYELTIKVESDPSKIPRYKTELSVCLSKCGRIEDADRVLSELTSWAAKVVADSPDKLASLATFDAAVVLANAAFDNKKSKVAERWYQYLAEQKDSAKHAMQGMVGLTWLDADGISVNIDESRIDYLLTESQTDRFAAEAVMAVANRVKVQNVDLAYRIYQSIAKTGHEPVAMTAILQASTLDIQSNAPERLELASRRLEKFVADFPSHESRDQAVYQLAWVFRDLKQDAAAVKYFKLLANEYDSSEYWSDAVYRLGDSAYEQSETATAIRWLSELEGQDHEDESVQHGLLLLAQIFASQNEWPKARRVTETLTERTTGILNLNSRYLMAEIEFRDGNIDKARQLFSDLATESNVASQSWQSMAILRLGQCLGRMDRWKEAKVEVSKIDSIDPEFQHQIDYITGRAHANIGEFEQARSAFSLVTGSEYANGSETAAMAQWMIGETYFHQGSFPLAVDAYMVVEREYNFVRWRALSMLQAAKCWAALNNAKQSKRLFERVQKIAPDTEYSTLAAAGMKSLENGKIKNASHRK